MGLLQHVWVEDPNLGLINHLGPMLGGPVTGGMAQSKTTNRPLSIVDEDIKAHIKQLLLGHVECKTFVPHRFSCLTSHRCSLHSTCLFSYLHGFVVGGAWPRAWTRWGYGLKGGGLLANTSLLLHTNRYFHETSVWGSHLLTFDDLEGQKSVISLIKFSFEIINHVGYSSTISSIDRQTFRTSNKNEVKSIIKSK